MKYVFSTQFAKQYRFPTHGGELIIDRSQCGIAEVCTTVVEQGDPNFMNQHDDMEQFFYILEGRGYLEIADDGQRYMFGPGDVIHIPIATPHRTTYLSGQRLRYLVINCFVNGKPKSEPTWDSHVKVICQQQGWDLGKVM